MLGLFQRDVDQIGEEGHSGAVGHLPQALEHRGDIFGGLLVRQFGPFAGGPRTHFAEAGPRYLTFQTALFLRRLRSNPAPKR